jgi:hypothetical protein
MDQKELKEAIFDMFRKSKETSNEPQAPKFKTIDSMLGGKMNLTAGDFTQLDPNSDPEKLKDAFKTAYLRGNTDSRTSLKTLLDTAPYNEMKDMVDQIDAAKGTANANPNRQFGASNQPTVRRSGGGFLREEQLRMQMLAGIITEGQYKAQLNENQVNNKYVVKDEELSNKDGDFYTIDLDKALDYLSQFDDEDIDAETFIYDDEGWGEFEQYLEDVEAMSDEELEDAMRREMSMYFFSDEDSI